MGYDSPYFYQMSHLPYAVPPTGRGSLGYPQKKFLEAMYPPLQYEIAPVPISCPPRGIRISQTGNSYNPNTQSGFGMIDPYKYGKFCY